MSNFPKLNEAGREEKESEKDAIVILKHYHEETSRRILHVIFFLNEIPRIWHSNYLILVMRLLGYSSQFAFGCRSTPESLRCQC